MKTKTGKESGDPTVSFRVPRDVEQHVLDLMAEIPGHDGGQGTRTDVGRALFRAFLGTDRVSRTLAIARRRGIPVATALGEVIDAGLNAINLQSTIDDPVPPKPARRTTVNKPDP